MYKKYSWQHHLLLLLQSTRHPCPHTRDVGAQGALAEVKPSRDHFELLAMAIHRLRNHIKAPVAIHKGPLPTQRRLLPTPLPSTALRTTLPSFLRVELDPTDIRNKSWYLHIPQGHRIGCADAPLTWSPITHFRLRTRLQ